MSLIIFQGNIEKLHVASSYIESDVFYYVHFLHRPASLLFPSSKKHFAVTLLKSVITYSCWSVKDDIKRFSTSTVGFDVNSNWVTKWGKINHPNNLLNFTKVFHVEALSWNPAKQSTSSNTLSSAEVSFIKCFMPSSGCFYCILGQGCPGVNPDPCS